MTTLRDRALAAIEAFNQWDIEAILGFRDESCIHEVLPKSLQQPPRDNAEYRTYFSATMPLFRNFHVTVDDVFEDIANKRVAIWCHSTADTAAGPYANEYVMMFHFNETGTKVVRVCEFVDSAFSKYFFGKLERLDEKQPIPSKGKL